MGSNRLPFKSRASVGGKVFLLLAVCFLAVFLILAPAWAYLRLRWSPHARALHAAKGERVAYLSDGLGDFILPHVRQGTLENIRLDWNWGKLGLLALRFEVRWETGHLSGTSTALRETGHLSGTLTALRVDMLQPLERPSKTGRFEPSTVFLCWCLTMGLWFVPAGRHILARQLAKAQAAQQSSDSTQTKQ